MLHTLKFTLDAMKTEVRCSITSASFNDYFYKTFDIREPHSRKFYCDFDMRYR